MIQLKFISRSAPSTRRFFPFALLHGRKGFSVATMRTSKHRLRMLELLEHFIAIVRPSLAKRGADFLSGFWRMFIALGRSRFLPRKRTASQCCSDAFKRFFGMSFSPKGIVLPGKLLALAFQRFAGHSIVIALQIICCSVYLFAANEAGEEFAGSRWCHISDNGVNSVDTPLYQIARNDARAIPSEAAQECAERVTTRAWSPERTVKPHERAAPRGEEIV